MTLSNAALKSRETTRGSIPESSTDLILSIKNKRAWLVPSPFLNPNGPARSRKEFRKFQKMRELLAHQTLKRLS